MTSAVVIDNDTGAVIIELRDGDVIEARPLECAQENAPREYDWCGIYSNE